MTLRVFKHSEIGDSDGKAIRIVRHWRKRAVEEIPEPPAKELPEIGQGVRGGAITGFSIKTPSMMTLTRQIAELAERAGMKPNPFSDLLTAGVITGDHYMKACEAAELLENHVELTGDGIFPPPAPPQEESNHRLYSQAHCPNCGAPGISYISQEDFCTKTGEGPSTVRYRIAKRIYCVDALAKLPWCGICCEHTPHGQNAERSVDAIPANQYQLGRAEKITILEWVTDLLPKMGFPKIDDSPHYRDTDPKVRLAKDLRGEGCRAVLELVRRHNCMPTREQAEAAAHDAINAKRKSDGRGRYERQLKRPDLIVDGEQGIPRKTPSKPPVPKDYAQGMNTRQFQAKRGKK